MKILPSKLRIEYSLENAALNETKLRPPHGDFAHNWNGYMQVTHIDIKIPSEHTICGKRFAGEYQIYYYHPKRRQPIVQSILIEIHPKERKHKHFQKALNEWQAVFDEQHANCLNAEREYYKNEERFLRRMENVLLTAIDNPNVSLRSNDGLERHGIRNRRQSTILDEPEEETQRFHSVLQKIRRRAADPKFEENYEKISFGTNSLVEGEEEAQGNSTQVPSINEHGNLRTSKSPSDAPSSTFFESETPQPSIMPSSTSPPSDQPTTFPSARIRWNPFHPRIVNSIYFYGYGGSLTEPPCSEWVSWRVLDTPMQISTAQWTQMRDILFGQLDGDCKRSSVHWRGSVARPTQGLNGRPLWKCTRDDYVSDVEKRRPSAAPSETTI
jgi:carbonic anhydrase